MALGLWNAVRQSRFKQLRFLVDKGASVNKENKDGQHTLVAALHIQDPEKRLKMFKYLIARGADFRAFDKKSGRDILLWAVYLNRANEAKIIMQELAGDLNFHKQDNYGRTIIHYATLRGNKDLLSYIVDQMKRFNVSVDVRDGEGFTPYMLAKRLQYQECADILLSDGEASPHQFDKNKKTIFQWADDGLKEEWEHINKDNKKRISTYKSLGRLPALRQANFEISQVNIVESSKDKFLLSNAIKREKTHEHFYLQDFSRVAARKHMPLSQSMNNLSSSSNLSDSESSRLRRLLLHSSHSSKSTDEAMKWINLKHDPDELNKHFTVRKPVTESLPELMTILEHQSCKSYRPYVKKPEYIEETKEFTKPKGGTLGSTMAIIFGKDGKKTVVKRDTDHVSKDSKKLATIKETSGGKHAHIYKKKIVSHS